MRCEVVAIGTELLLGIIVDSNSAWIGEQLALAGIDCFYQVKVGDNFGRIEACIRQALERSDAVICCGGLGPTQDDITRDVIARVMGVEMRRDDAIAAKIRHMFEVARPGHVGQQPAPGRYPGRRLSHRADAGHGAGPRLPVRRQGDLRGAGRAARDEGDVHGHHAAGLAPRSGQSAVIRSRVLRSWGLSESGIDEMVADRMKELDTLGNPTIAFQASGIDGIKVRVVAKCDDEATAKRILDSEETLMRGLLGDAVFGIDDQSMEAVVLGELRKRGMTMAAAETLTGGDPVGARECARPGYGRLSRGYCPAGDDPAGRGQGSTPITRAGSRRRCPPAVRHAGRAGRDRVRRDRG